MKNTFLTAIIILFVLNIFLAYNVYNLKTENAKHRVFISTSDANLKKKSNEIVDLNKSLLSNLSLNNQKLILEEIILTDRNSKTITLADLTRQNDKTLLYRIPNELCDPCVNRVLNEIKKTKIDGNAIALIVSDINLLQKNDYNLSNLGIETYLIDNTFSLDLEQENKAYFFAVNYNGDTSDGYIPLESNTFFIKSYIHKILN